MKKIKIIVAVLAVFVCLNFMLRGIDKYKSSSKLAGNSSYNSLTPVEFISTVALGGFRAAAIDFVWIRAVNAWEKKQWYEALALYRLISKLQPKLTNIWIINAWNMIYNISIDMKHNEREAVSWEWIKQGTNFLKEGIKRNPESADLYFYLGWVYFDKGKDAYYRKQFISEGENPVKNACHYIGKAAELGDDKYYFYNYWYAFMLRERSDIEETEGDYSQALLSINNSIELLQLAEENVPEHADFIQFKDGIANRLKEFNNRKIELEKKLNG